MRACACEKNPHVIDRARRRSRDDHRDPGPAGPAAGVRPLTRTQEVLNHVLCSMLYAHYSAASLACAGMPSGMRAHFSIVCSLMHGMAQLVPSESLLRVRARRAWPTLTPAHEVDHVDRGMTAEGLWWLVSVTSMLLIRRSLASMDSVGNSCSASRTIPSAPATMAATRGCAEGWARRQGREGGRRGRVKGARRTAGGGQRECTQHAQCTPPPPLPESAPRTLARIHHGDRLLLHEHLRGDLVRVARLHDGHALHIDAEDSRVKLQLVDHGGAQLGGARADVMALLAQQGQRCARAAHHLLGAVDEHADVARAPASWRWSELRAREG